MQRKPGIEPQRIEPKINYDTYNSDMLAAIVASLASNPQLPEYLDAKQCLDKRSTANAARKRSLSSHCQSAQELEKNEQQNPEEQARIFYSIFQTPVLIELIQLAEEKYTALSKETPADVKPIQVTLDILANCKKALEEKNKKAEEKQRGMEPLENQIEQLKKMRIDAELNFQKNPNDMATRKYLLDVSEILQATVEYMELIPKKIKEMEAASREGIQLADRLAPDQSESESENDKIQDELLREQAFIELEDIETAYQHAKKNFQKAGLDIFNLFVSIQNLRSFAQKKYMSKMTLLLRKLADLEPNSEQYKKTSFNINRQANDIIKKIKEINNYDEYDFKKQKEAREISNQAFKDFDGLLDNLKSAVATFQSPGPSSAGQFFPKRKQPDEEGTVVIHTEPAVRPPSPKRRTHGE